MPNIPRRKIYEELLKYEDILIEMHILLYNKENFIKFESKFSKKLPKLHEIFLKINSLLVLFFENKKFETENEFNLELNKLEKKFEEIVIPYLKSNKNLKSEFKKLLEEINDKLTKINKIENYEKGKEFYKILDKFNFHIPKILQIRRDKMKK